MADDNLVSLHSYLKANSPTTDKIATTSEITPLSLEAFFPVALQITDIISQLHQHQVIHRQLNLDHFLIAPETQQLKLTDFSQAWKFPLTTSPYSPPEAVTASSYYHYDLYSLGIIFTQLLTGTILPVESYPQSLKISGIPNEIAKILLKLTAKNPRNRKFLEDTGLDNEIEIIDKSDYDLPWTTEEADFYRECNLRVMENNAPESYIRETTRKVKNKVCWLDTKKIPLIKM